MNTDKPLSIIFIALLALFALLACIIFAIFHVQFFVVGETSPISVLPPPGVPFG